ncbi:hypothetical protein X777_15124 [Ooceraea biroi]|uniref:BED-type domain-containing protein n=1 Tax=Ooceraea biroi TaxID=2015173 RepID=A0A026VYG0_OOCBI|nr:hypothetical protein X777_15124 [Ooceraea biroi]
MGVIYKIDCKNCDSKTRIKEHMSNIRKHSDSHSVVSKHRLDNGHEFDWNAKIIHRENLFKKRETAEMFYIKRCCNSINSQRDTENWPDVYNDILMIA